MMAFLNGVERYFIAVLVCIYLKIAMLTISSCAYWPPVYLLWRNVYLVLLPIFQLGCLVFAIELYELSVYFGN